MMYSKVIVFLIVHTVYFGVWYLVYKIRVSKHYEFRLWDNGYDFYTSLDKHSKELYWREDTKIIHIFFIVFLFFLEITLFLQFVYFNKWYWLISLMAGIILCVSTAIVLSIRLQKKFLSSKKQDSI